MYGSFNKDKFLFPDQQQETKSNNCFNKALFTSIKENCFKFLTGFTWRDFVAELKAHVIIAISVVFTEGYRFVTNFVTIALIGQIGKLAMDSVILNQIMINLFCNSVRRGLLSASVTAFSQTYGNLDHRHHLKVLYLRYFVILNAIALLIVGICLNIEPILILLKQDPVTAKLASMYMIYYSPSIIFESNYILLSRLIQSYKRVVPVVISGTIGIITDISGQVIILLVLKLPYYYVALSKSIPPLIMYSVLLVACAITDFKSEVGLLFNNPLNVTFTSLISEWKSYFKLAIPGVLGGILFSLTYEISSLVAGSVSNNDLAAYGIGFQINFINAFIPVCFSVAVGIRVGHFLGANDIVSAKRSMFVSIMSILCYSIPVAIVTASTASFIPRMFTQNATLIRNVRNIIFVLCIIIALKFFNLLISILFACGKQLLVFIAYIFSLFIIGLTVGLLTALLCNLGAFGLWIGHACGTVCLVITFFIFLLCTIQVLRDNIMQNRTAYLIPDNVNINLPLGDFRECFNENIM